MHNHLKTLLISCIFSGSVCAAESAQMRNLEQRIGVLEQRTGAKGLRNPPARMQVEDGCNLAASVELLYWNYHTDDLSVCIKSRSLVASQLLHASVRHAPFAWDWGFRLGLSYNIPHDHWEASLKWIHYWPGKEKASVGASNGGTTGTLVTTQARGEGAPVTVNHSRASSRLRLDLLDAQIGRHFFVSRFLSVKPTVGLRAAQIDQHFGVGYKGGATLGATQKWGAHFKNDFWGVGLIGGLDTRWSAGGGWSLYGNAALSLLYGVFSKRVEQESEAIGGTSSTSAIEASSKFRSTKAITDLALGARWERLFEGGRYGLIAQLGWEHHLFFSQTQYLSRFAISQEGDLSTQGWTLSATFAF